MTVAQLDSLVTLLRSRPAPETTGRRPVTRRLREDGGLPGRRAGRQVRERSMPAACRPNGWRRRASMRERAVLYLHGGGYAIGSLNTHRRLAYDISAASGARVLVIDYRLAPEHPFPAAVDDAAAAWRWLLQQGLDSEAARDRGQFRRRRPRDRHPGQSARPEARPAGLRRRHLAVGRSRGSRRQHHRTRAAQDPMVQKDGLLWMAGMYLAGKDAKTPLAAPLHADLKGLPPILVQVGTAETLLDDATRIAEKLHTAGVDVKLVDLAEHAARLPLLRADPLGGPRRLPRDRHLHPQPHGVRSP